MLTNELLSYLFDGRPHLLGQPIASWLRSSRRFMDFAETFRSKIRKKLRASQDQETAFDLQLELHTAYLLLQERTLSLEYEPRQPAEGRGPDFAVSYTSSMTFMLEVTRLRAEQNRKQENTAVPGDTSSIQLADRLADTACSKLGQLLHQQSNVLLIGVDTLQVSQSDFSHAMLRVQQRIESNDQILLRRHRFRDRADFFRHYQRLSEILVCDATRQNPAFVWINSQAKQPLPSRVRTVLYRSQMG